MLVSTPEFGVAPPRDSASLPLFAKFYADVVRYGIARDPAFDWTTFDPTKPGKYAARIARLSDIVDAKKTDISAFEARGGKLIVWHGLADQIVSHHSLETYHDAVVKQMGQQRVHGFSRFYLVPGLGHGVGAFQPAWDSLKALEHWVEDGSPPANVVVKDVSPDNAGRTRPLCEIGSWPVYLGGDVRAASSFRCGDHVAQASAK